MNRKIIAIALISVLVANLVLFAFRITNTMIFWAVIIAVALFTYFRFNKKK
ncbi:MAG: hypothetical protein NT001_02220 [Candidatus Woesearchaeota archaeon]|nr:hypothetical protein [Candidatus Woesearchaeota archaeon]